jgi:hypothetical protein
MTTSVRPLLVNGHEVLTDRELGRAAEQAGFRVAPKVRIADVLPIDRSGLSNEHYRYALQAHFDFVVTEGDERIPQFAVEFDGPMHDDAKVAARDAMKDAICDWFEFPLLRIDGTFLRRVRRNSLVGLLVDAWAAYQGFLAAQEAGTMPRDEPWCYFGVFQMDEATGKVYAPLALDSAGRGLIQQLCMNGETKSFAPTSLTRHPRGKTMPTVYTSYAMVELADGTFVTAEGNVRAFRFPPIYPWELAEDLAIENLRMRLRLWMEGHHIASPRSVVEQIRRDHPQADGWYSTGLVHDAWKE